MAEGPKVRTHSVYRVVTLEGDRFVCRGCGTRWPTWERGEALERQPCGTPAPPTHPDPHNPQTSQE